MRGLIFLVVLQIFYVHSASPRYYYDKCNVWDSACITRQVQRALPSITADVVNELNSKSFDPFIIDVAEFDFAGLKIDFYKAILKSIRGLTVDRFDIDTDTQKMRIICHTDATIRGKYSVNGNVLGFDVNENGDAEIDTHNFQIQFLMPFEVVKNYRGENVFDLKKFRYSYDVKDKVQYSLTNLFPGNQLLNQTAHQLLNKNWRLVMTTYGKSVMDIAATKMFNAIRSYLLTLPIDQILYTN